MKYIKYLILFFIVTSCYGPQPLYKEILKENYEYIEARLESGADPNYKSRKGVSPLVMVIDKGEYKKAELLLKYSARVDTDWNKKSILYSLLSKRWKDDKTPQEFFDLLSKLIEIDKESGFELFNYETIYTAKAIYLSFHSERIFKFLLEKGVPFDSNSNIFDQSVAVYALKSNADPKVIDYLLDMNPKLVENRYFPIALSNYEKRDELKHREILEPFFVSQNLENNKTKDTIFIPDYSINSLSKYEYFNEVLEHWNNSPDYLIDIKSGMLDNYCSLLEFVVLLEKSNTKYSKYSRYEYGNSSFYTNCNYLNKKTKLCSHKIVIYPSELVDSLSILHFASILDRDDKIEEIVLNKKISPNIKTKKGITPLMIASWLGNVGVIEVLLKNGANIDEISHYNQTALFFAVTNRQYNAVKLLLSRGANINHSDIFQNRALHFAKWNSDSKMIEILKEHNSEESLNIFSQK
ncbi:ankyrin repeat domain-containing protein [bacterium]|nr:ankyrin repeat domain-containing protein [bacterium]